MLIVLTSEKKIDTEPETINLLFENGLEVLHLRKPSFEKEEYRDLLLQIKKEYLNKVVLHDFHELSTEFKLKGIHLKEKKRKDLGNETEEYLKKYRGSVSTSFHNKESIKKNKTKFDYFFLSPVFDSISKQGYCGKEFNVKDIDEYVIGMGGINKENVNSAFDLGFKGVGVLGSIWNNNKPIQSFIEIKKEIN